MRISVAGGSYHVVARGNAKQRIFADDRDHHVFLNVLAQALARFQWRCLTYCLMPNHYHLLLTTSNADLSRGMRHINGVYAQAFNRRHDRCGHLFQGRFGATLIESDQHMLESIRYVVLNPVRAGLARRPEDWPWSAYRELFGDNGKRLLSVDDLLAHFGSSTRDALLRYREFVAAGDSEPGTIYGQSANARAIPPDQLSPEIATPRLRNRPSLAELLEGEEDRDLAITRAYRDHGYLMREIADALRCHYATVSRAIRRFENRLS
jgi:REP element-mobilizing transposase RayT